MSHVQRGLGPDLGGGMSRGGSAAEGVGHGTEGVPVQWGLMSRRDPWLQQGTRGSVQWGPMHRGQWSHGTYLWTEWWTDTTENITFLQRFLVGDKINSLTSSCHLDKTRQLLSAWRLLSIIICYYCKEFYLRVPAARDLAIELRAMCVNILLSESLRSCEW